MDHYHEVETQTTGEVYAAIERDDPKELLLVPISVSMTHPNLEWSQEICLKLAKHQDSQVRGNAVLGFGHLARRFGKLNKEAVLPVIESALAESDQIVNGQAWAAADDVSHFLGWKVAGFDAESDVE